MRLYKKISRAKDVSKPQDTSKLKKVFENDGYNKMNEAIGRMLKRLCKEHNMSVKDVKQRLHDDYGVDVAEKTLRKRHARRRRTWQVRCGN